MLCRIKHVVICFPISSRWCKMNWSFNKLELPLQHAKSLLNIFPCSFLPQGELLLALTNWGLYRTMLPQQQWDCLPFLGRNPARPQDNFSSTCGNNQASQPYLQLHALPCASCNMSSKIFSIRDTRIFILVQICNDAVKLLAHLTTHLCQH
jgi:hypothetical protein